MFKKFLLLAFFPLAACVAEWSPLMITGNGQVIVNQDAESQSEWVSPVVATPEAVTVINLGELDTLKSRPRKSKCS